MGLRAPGMMRRPGPWSPWAEPLVWGCTCTQLPLFIYFFKFKFIYFNWRLITLQYCIGFVIHQHESATGHVFPILNPPPTSLPIPFLWNADLVPAVPSEVSELSSLCSGQTHSISFHFVCFGALQTRNSLKILALTAYSTENILLLTLPQLRSLPPSFLSASYLSRVSPQLLI